jgi:hypothetical protein
MFPNHFGGTIVSGSALPASFVTNPSSGGNITVSDNTAGLISASRGTLISSDTADLTVIGQGYALRGASASQASGGPLVLTRPYNGAIRNIDALQLAPGILCGAAAPVDGGSVCANYQGKASSNHAATRDYQDVMTLIEAANF